MSSFTVKVYVVQQADRHGNLIGPVLAAKLTLKDAHAIAKEFAPAKVTCINDKTPVPNGPDHVAHHGNAINCKPDPFDSGWRHCSCEQQRHAAQEAD